MLYLSRRLILDAHTFRACSVEFRAASDAFGSDDLTLYCQMLSAGLLRRHLSPISLLRNAFR